MVKREDSPAVALKRKKEMILVEEMIRLYCKKKHHRSAFCHECEELLNYALTKVKFCPVMEKKKFCSSCRIHCYGEPYKGKIKTVMKTMGPWMLLYHPKLAVKHMLQGLAKD